MAFKAILLCASAVLVQSTYSAILGGLAGPYGLAGTGCAWNSLATPGLAFEGFIAPALAYEGFGCGCAGVASTGGGLPCASASPIPPVGVSILSENVYEGILAAGGSLPFLGTVALEGVLPTAGAGAVSYGCGGPIGIAAEEGVIATGIAPHAPGPYGAYGPGLAARYNSFGALGFGGIGCGVGCGTIY